MDPAIAITETLIRAIRGYLFAGLLFSLVFVLFGVQRVDPGARGWHNLGFRVIIIPGMCVFWPLFATRWLRGRHTPPIERNPHRDAAALSLAPGSERQA